jgi:hypothetical protein
VASLRRKELSMDDQERRRKGPIPKWTQEREDRLIDALASRHSRVSACQLAGVDFKTYRRWMNGRSMPGRLHLVPFATRVADAEAAAHAGALDVVNKRINQNDLKAATWYLERCHPERYGRTGTLFVKSLEKLSDDELIEHVLAGASKTVTEERQGAA